MAFDRKLLNSNEEILLDLRPHWWFVTPQVAMVVAGHTSRVAAMAGLSLPVETHLLQAMVTEPVKPVLDTVVMSAAYDAYVSQTNKGEILMGAELDFYPSYSQRGNLPRIEDIARYTLTMFPSFGRLRLMRSWAGINDMTMDGSPLNSEKYSTSTNSSRISAISRSSTRVPSGLVRTTISSKSRPTYAWPLVRTWMSPASDRMEPAGRSSEPKRMAWATSAKVRS